MYSILDFDFELPESLIANQPLKDRSASRMMVVDRAAAQFRDGFFAELPDLLSPDDLLVVNNTQVFPARLLGRTDTGARVEIFLVNEEPDGTWTGLARPARRLREGKRLDFGPELAGEVVERLDDGKVRVKFFCEDDIFQAIEKVGRTPLPPYIKRDADGIDSDRERYQTIYARHRGAIAAPTAGLHFTPEVLGKLRERNIEIAEVTLHVGYGTFEPVRAEDLRSHRVSAERYVISEAAANSLNAAHNDGRRIIAVGTTTTRTLEYSIAAHGRFVAGSGEADLTILPGFEFKAINGLLTNFHLPKSSLLVLVSAFAGRELIMNAYRHAVDSAYRFYSYGDCMLIT